MSQVNPGVSINFDAQALHDAEEEEYRREEAERQNELRAALLDAFDDDLSDEESDVSRDHGLSMMSQDGESLNGALGQRKGSDHAVYGQEPPALPVTAPPVAQSQGHIHRALDHSSTPMTGYAPPLTTPGAQYHQDYHHPDNQWEPNPQDQLLDTEPIHEQAAQYGSYGNPYMQQDYENHYDTDPQHQDGYYGESGAVRVRPDFDRGEIEGANDEDHTYRDNFQPIYHQSQQPVTMVTDQYGYPLHHGNDGHEYPDNYNYHTNYNYVETQQAAMLSDDRGMNIPTRDTEPVHTQTAPVPSADALRRSANSRQEANQHFVNDVPPNTNSDSDLDAYRVKYHRNQIRDEHTDQQIPAKAPETRTQEDTTHNVPATTPGGDYDDLQKDFRNKGSSQVEQLQILYTARGRKIEELTESLKTLQEDSDREIRILKHKLTITQDERDGLSDSLDQCQQLLQDGHQKEADVQGRAAALEHQLEALAAAKEELIKKVETHEVTIENLNVQLVTLEASESLSRARNQHESILSGITQKHDAQILSLKQKLDKVQTESVEKDTEIGNLKKQVCDLLKSVENTQIDRADTINRLTRSLEDSQRHCQQILEAGHGQEASKLKMQLQEVIAGKSIAEDMNSALQGELKEMKEQVMMYESASQFGLFSTTGLSQAPGKPSAGVMDDSYAQLGIRTSSSSSQPMWQTPETGSNETPTLSNEGTIHGLKSELERCLHMYKNKREQVTQLQDSLRTTKASMDQYKLRADRALEDANKYKDELRAITEKVGDSINADNPRESMLRKDIEKLTQEKENLESDLQEVQKRLEETASNEEEVSALNQELMAQMAQMVQEFDEDKKTALEKCQENILKHHDDNTARLKQELEEKFDSEKTNFETEWQEKLQLDREQVQSLQAELDEVKDHYVSVCRAKDQLEEELAQQYDSKLQQQINELKSTLSSEKEDALEQLHMTLTATSEQNQAKAKEEWQLAEEESTQRRVKSEVAQSKSDWFHEHQALRDQAVERALKVCNMDWQQRWDSELRGSVEQELLKVQSDWDSKKQTELENRLEIELANAKVTWREQELEEALRRATQEALEDKDTQVQEALTKARDTWETEQAGREGRDDHHSDVLQIRLQVEEASRELKQELDQVKSEKQSVDKEFQHQRAMWLQEREQLIKQKDMERRQALLDVQEQSSAEYKQFLAEHQDTLNRALTAAKEEHVLEKATLETQFKEQIEALKKCPPKVPEAQKQLLTDKAELDREWQTRLEVLSKSHEEQTNILMTTHRENMAKALDEAREKWQQKLELVLEEHEKSILEEREKQWETERAEFEAAISERDQLLHNTDLHMEMEISKLHEEMERQKEIQLAEELHKLQDGPEVRFQVQELDAQDLHRECEDRLRATVHEVEEGITTQHREELQQELQGLEQKHEADLRDLQEELSRQHEEILENRLKELEEVLVSRYESQVQNLRQDMDKECSEKLAFQQGEVEKILTKLEDSRKQLKDLYTRYTKDTRNLAKKVEQLDHELKKARAELGECETKLQINENQKAELVEKIANLENELQKAEKQQSEFLEKVTNLETDFEKAEKQRQTVVDAMKQSEKEHETIVSNYKLRNDQLNEKVQKAEKQLKMVKAEAQHQLLLLQESMDREQAVSIDNMKAKILDMSRKQAAAIDKMKADHVKETEQLLREQAVKQEERAIQDMRDQYLEAVEKIREDVVKHMSQSNEKAAATVKFQIIRERQLTARRLRRYYMKCLSHMLDKEYDPVSKQQKLSAMEQYLEQIPERDSSRSTTPSVHSGGSSKPATPVADLSQHSDEGQASVDDRARTVDLIDSNQRRNEGFKVPLSVPSQGPSRSNSAASSSRPSSTSSDRHRDQWTQPKQSTIKPSRNDIQSTMTYPVPSIKNSSPAGNGRPAVVSASGRTTADSSSSRNHGRGKSLEAGHPVESFRNALETSMDLNMSVSTPDLSPRQVGLSEREEAETPTPGYCQGDESFTEDNNRLNVSIRSVSDRRRRYDARPRSPAYNAQQLSVASDKSPSSGRYKTMAFREISTPVEDILNKYTTAPQQATLSAWNEDYKPQGRSSDHGALSPRSTRHGLNTRTLLSKSTENLNLSSSLLSPDGASGVSGYKYTSLRNILSSKSHSKSSSQLHMLSSEPQSFSITGDVGIDIDITPRTRSGQQSVTLTTKYKTPPERLPAKQHYQQREVGNLQSLQMFRNMQITQDIDISDSNNNSTGQEPITPRADREVATLTGSKQANTRENHVLGSGSGSIPRHISARPQQLRTTKSRSDKEPDRLQRPIPLVTRHTQAP